MGSHCLLIKSDVLMFVAVINKAPFVLRIAPRGFLLAIESDLLICGKGVASGKE